MTRLISGLGSQDKISGPEKYHDEDDIRTSDMPGRRFQGYEATIRYQDQRPEKFHNENDVRTRDMSGRRRSHD